ncbi:glycosyltransferase family 2 protein [Cetobacterium somerae]|uniref:glycosyltransferase family 2 protein n=1 Tax=Cetobacterium somerae TaxID=188913 RepID=UPI002259A558|nr:glycosyltransferase family 2 protein [Cetobacterium somerae]MCX3066999.1 glycosyltransferase family 2 protein [Cetobacterium somerae]
MKVSVICPVYNGEKYLKNLFSEVREQENIEFIEIIAPISKSSDNSLEEAKKYADIAYEVNNFNHGRTRHEAALKANGDYLVFITQDIVPVDKLWLYNLIKDLSDKTVAAFSKQIAYKEHGEIEKLIREFNYPDMRRICSKENAEINGRKNIFYSDAASVIIKEEFFRLGGYNFIVPTNEDVVLANNIIKNGKSFIYEPNSKIYHSHKLSFKENYKRYEDIGKFEKLYSKEIDFSNTSGEGKKLVIFVIKNLLKKGKILELGYFGIDILVRLLGYRKERK